MAQSALAHTPYDPEEPEDSPSYLHALEKNEHPNLTSDRASSLRVVRPQDTESEDDSYSSAVDRRGLKSIEGNPNAVRDKSAPKPDLRIVGGNPGQNTSPTNPQDFYSEKRTFRNSILNRHRKVITASLITLLTGGGIAGFFGVSLFFGLTKVEGITQQLDSKFQTTIDASERTEENNLLKGYIVKHLLPGMGQNLCASTADTNRSCFVPGKSQGLVRSLYQAWSQKRLENQLASKYNFELFKQNGKTYMKVGDVSKALTSTDIAALENGTVDLADEARILGLVSNRISVDDLLSLAGKDATLWDRIFFRLKYGKLLERKYGIKLCLVACDLKKKLDGKVSDFKNFFKAATVDEVINPGSDEAAQALRDLVEGDDSDVKLQPTTDPGLPEASPAQDSVTQAFAQAGETTAADMVANYSDVVSKASAELADNSVDEIVAEKAVEEVGGKAAAGSASAAVDSVDPATWALIVSQIYRSLAVAGEVLKAYGFAVKVTSAIRMFMMLKTVVSEFHSGNTSIAALGSINDALHTNMTNSSSDSADATSTPLYARYFGGGVDPNSTSYRCNDGSKVPTGKLVCSEELFTAGNQTVSNISNFLNGIPVISQLATAINSINQVIGDITNFAFSAACAVPGMSNLCTAAGNALAQVSSGFIQWLLNILLPNIFTDHMSGGRIFDMAAAGADASYNKSCQVQLGCAKLSNQQLSVIQNQEIAYQKRQFDAMPLFARMFSTSTPYSLVSRLAVIWPTSLTDASTQVASAMGNPFKSLASIISNIFTSPHAFAASQPFDDPFGIIQYGYTADQIPSDPETYWNDHCQNNPTYAVDWENSQQQDPDTGEPVATSPQPCLLIQSSVESAGTLFDSSLAPAGSLTPDPSQ